jgi:hypothetical protein
VNRERRRHPRIALRKPILASIGTTAVFVLDASRGGLRVAHQSQIPAPGAVCRVNVPSEGGPIQLDCAIVHTAIEHANAAARRLFSSGLQIVSADSASTERFEKILRPSGKKKK